RPIARSVVDDEDFDDVDAGDGPRKIRQRRRQRVGLVEARNLDDELFQRLTRSRESRTPRIMAILAVFAIQEINASITPSHVIRAAEPWPASPIDAASRLLAARRLKAAESAPGSGSVTYPLTPSTTNSFGPPESEQVITGFLARNASSVTYPKSSSYGG